MQECTSTPSRQMELFSKQPPLLPPQAVEEYQELVARIIRLLKRVPRAQRHTLGAAIQRLTAEALAN